MENINSLVSVIVPVYNSEKTIERCIESVLNQTYNNFELIIINDGSKDNSLKLISKYKDKRIKVYNQENAGVSSARNSGIKKANGEYIVFLDSDDCLKANCLEIFLKEIIANKCELVVCGYDLYTTDSVLISKNVAEKKLFNKNELKQELEKIYMFNFFAGPVLKILSQKIIYENNILFNANLSLSEDSCFILDYLKYCYNIEIIPDKLYTVYQSNCSLSNKDRKDIWENQKFLYNKYVEFIGNKSDANNFLIRSIAISINYSIHYKWSKKDFNSLCLNILNFKDFKEIKISKLNSFKNKMFYILLKFKMFKLIKIILNSK